jgi:uncharacterized protein YigE (DUF2233 family)
LKKGEVLVELDTLQKAFGNFYLQPNGVFFLTRKGQAGVNLYDFATFFQSLGCKNALYLDGFVSRMYLPSEGREQLDGNFGAMIGYSRPRK